MTREVNLSDLTFQWTDRSLVVQAKELTAEVAEFAEARTEKF